jgi:hypothetical protein
MVWLKCNRCGKCQGVLISLGVRSQFRFRGVTGSAHYCRDGALGRLTLIRGTSEADAYTD